MYKMTTIAEKFDHGIQDQDAVLRLLYEFHNNIFNPRDIPLSLESLSDTVGLNKEEVKEICDELAKKHLISYIPFLSGPFYKITNNGIAHIEKRYAKRGRTVATRR